MDPTTANFIGFLSYVVLTGIFVLTRNTYVGLGLLVMSVLGVICYFTVSGHTSQSIIALQER
jgi:hypothetical protein